MDFDICASNDRTSPQLVPTRYTMIQSGGGSAPSMPRQIGSAVDDMQHVIVSE